MLVERSWVVTEIRFSEALNPEEFEIQHPALPLSLEAGDEVIKVIDLHPQTLVSSVGTSYSRATILRDA